MKTKLKPGFMFVTQSGSCGKLTHKESFTIINHTLKKCFDNVLPYNVFLQSFADLWGFNMAWDNHISLSEIELIKNYNFNYFDIKIKEKIKKNEKLYNFDGESFVGQINLPKYLRNVCE